MSVAHRTLAELEAATAASALAITEATAAWRIVYDDGAGDNDAATAAWEKVEELQGEWDSAAWEECEALKAMPWVEGPVERGLSLSAWEECEALLIAWRADHGLSLAAYELRVLPHYAEAERQLWRIVELLRARRYAPAGIEPWTEKARALGKKLALIRTCMEAHRAVIAAEKEISVLRAAAAASGDMKLGWPECVAAAGRAAAARKLIDTSHIVFLA